MNIGLAYQVGQAVVVYSDHGVELFRKPGELIGFTDATVTVRQRGSRQMHMYDAAGGHRAIIAAPASFDRIQPIFS